VKKKSIACRQRHCDDPPHLGGYCKLHYEKKCKEDADRESALTFLHTGTIDGRLATCPDLAIDIMKIRDWWRQVCQYMQMNKQHPLLQDETECGSSWCIRLGIQIVHAEKAFRNTEPLEQDQLKYARDEVWFRFENIEKGLMSNGIARPESRQQIH